MTVLSSFEILSENLVPTSIIPSGPDNPLLIQGYFTQISLSPGATVSSVNFNLIFQETTGFTQGAGKAALKAQVIDAAGRGSGSFRGDDWTSSGVLRLLKFAQSVNQSPAHINHPTG